ncbi:MAG: Tfp pilus assembly protein FimT/FimU, partial [Phycisphaerae bacterium]
MTRVGSCRRGFTLLELILVMGILITISAMAIPNILSEIRQDRLPRSARQLRSLVMLVRAHAAFDGKRLQIRFPRKDELDTPGGDLQPRVEREDDPIQEPEVFNLVTDSWAIGNVLMEGVWCAQVIEGRPTIAGIRDRRDRVAEQIEDVLREASREDQYEPERPPLVMNPDGSSEWVTFVLTTAPRDIKLDKLENYPRIDLIVEGLTGLAWLQRPFYDEELDLFEDKGWPAVLRQDFL